MNDQISPTLKAHRPRDFVTRLDEMIAEFFIRNPNITTLFAKNYGRLSLTSVDHKDVWAETVADCLTALKQPSRGEIEYASWL